MIPALPALSGPDLRRAVFGAAPQQAVLIEWFTPDCAPCRKLQPILAAVAQEWPTQLQVFRADASDPGNGDWVEAHGIRAVPTLSLWRQGREIDRRQGFVAPADLRRWLAAHLSSPTLAEGASPVIQNLVAPEAPTAPGPFSHATRVGPWLFTAGMGGLDPATGEVVSDDVVAQTRQALRNVRAILAAAGYQLTDVVKVTLYLTDMADYERVNAVYAEVFGDHRPARTCVAVSALPKRERMKLDTVAYREAQP